MKFRLWFDPLYGWDGENLSKHHAPLVYVIVGLADTVTGYSSEFVDTYQKYKQKKAKQK